MKKQLLLALLLCSANLFAQSLQTGKVTLSTALLDFDLDGDTTLANTLDIDSLSLWIYNGKSEAVTMTDVNFADSVFSVRDTNVVVNPRDSARIWVRFRTNQNITWNDVGVIETSGGNGSQAFRVKATGRYDYNNVVESRYRVTQGLFGAALKTQLKTLATQNAVTLGYNTARDEMFMEVDNKRLNGQGATINTLECVYTGRLVTGYTSRSDAQTNGNFNTEHTWPQGQFGSADPMQSDMHHLFPTDETANNQRSSFPFGTVTGTPTYQNGGSKLGSNGATTVFEPRDAHKGILSRSMIYFVTRYDQNYGDFWTENGVNQEATFRNWNRRFPANAIERRRNDDIADNTRQRNRNPFIDHPEFVERIAAFTGNANFTTAPEILVSPLALNFGNVGIGDSADAQLVIVNQGSATLNITSVTTLSAPYRVVNSPTSISSETFATILIRFKPETISTFNASLAIGSNDADEPNTIVALSGFSTFAVPVELATFNAVTIQNGIELRWTTASEQNNEGFYIERRTAIDDWKSLGFVQGNGTTTEPLSYSFVDQSASGKVLYRLKQVDFDGKFDYSAVVEADAPVAQVFALDQNYPNPFNPVTTIGYQLPISSDVKLQVFDVLGRTVATVVNTRQEAGSYNYNFNASAYNLSSGVYFYRLQAGSVIQTKKMILAK